MPSIAEKFAIDGFETRAPLPFLPSDLLMSADRASSTAPTSFGDRPVAVALVAVPMAGGVLAGFLGPQVAKWSVDWLAPVTFAGVYVAMAVFSVAVLLLVQFVRIPRLSVADRTARGRPPLPASCTCAASRMAMS